MLRIENLTKTYGDKRTVDNLTLSIHVHMRRCDPRGVRRSVCIPDGRRLPEI